MKSVCVLLYLLLAISSNDGSFSLREGGDAAFILSQLGGLISGQRQSAVPSLRQTLVQLLQRTTPQNQISYQIFPLGTLLLLHYIMQDIH